MRLAGKLLLLGLVLIILITLGSRILKSVGSSLPKIPVAQQSSVQPTAVIPPPGVVIPAPAQTQGVPPLPSVQQQVVTGSNIKAKQINPVILTDAEISMERGKARLNVFNVECSPDDNLPPAPVFISTWIDFDTKDVRYGKKTKNTAFTPCTLGNFKFYYQAPEDGLYIFGVKQYGDKDFSRLSLRANGVQVFSSDYYETGSETLTLQKGWYEVDLRLWKYEHPYRNTKKGFTLLVKTPAENEMHVLTNSEIYMGSPKTIIVSPGTSDINPVRK